MSKILNLKPYYQFHYFYYLYYLCYFLFIFLLLIFPINLFANSNWSFYPKASITEQNKIYLEVKRPENNLLEVKIMGKNIFQPVLGLAFDLEYDSKMFSYKKYLAGSFLEKGGQPIYLVSLDKNQANLIVVGASLKRGDELPLGSGHFLSLFFKIRKNGRSVFNFQNVSLASLDIKKRQIESVNWIDGEIEINQTLSQTGQTDIINMFPANTLWIIIGLIMVLGSGLLISKRYIKRK